METEASEPRVTTICRSSRERWVTRGRPAFQRENAPAEPTHPTESHDQKLRSLRSTLSRKRARVRASLVSRPYCASHSFLVRREKRDARQRISMARLGSGKMNLLSHHGVP